MTKVLLVREPVRPDIILPFDEWCEYIHNHFRMKKVNRENAKAKRTND